MWCVLETVELKSKLVSSLFLGEIYVSIVTVFPCFIDWRRYTWGSRPTVHYWLQSSSSLVNGTVAFYCLKIAVHNRCAWLTYPWVRLAPVHLPLTQSGLWACKWQLPQLRFLGQWVWLVYCNCFITYCCLWACGDLFPFHPGTLVFFFFKIQNW